MWQGIDQRKFPRTQCKCVVKLQQKEKSSDIPAVTENVGLGGVCVLLRKGLNIFSQVLLEITLDDGKAPLRLPGTIVWVVRRRQIRKEVGFDTGIEFVSLEPQDKARLEACIDKASAEKQRS